MLFDQVSRMVDTPARRGRDRGKCYLTSTLDTSERCKIADVCADPILGSIVLLRLLILVRVMYEKL